MKHPAEKNHFYRSAAAAAVIAAIASASAPAWAETDPVTYEHVTESIPAGEDAAPASIVITGFGIFPTPSEADAALTETVTTEGTPGVYLPSDGTSITIRADESVTIGGGTAEAGSLPVLIASDTVLSLTTDYSKENAMIGRIIIPGAPAFSLSGGRGGSIDIETGKGGAITLGSGIVLLSGGDSASPLTFTVNGEGNASSVAVDSTIIASGANTSATLNLTGAESSFTGWADASDGASIEINVTGELVDSERNADTKVSAGTLSGPVSARNGGSVTITASDADVSKAFLMAGPGGSVTVNLKGGSWQGSRSSEVIAYVYGKDSQFKETAGSGTDVMGSFMGAGGSQTSLQFDGSWNGDAVLSSLLPIEEYGTDENGKRVMTGYSAPLASSMTITANGDWQGDAEVYFPSETQTQDQESSYYGLEPQNAVLKVTANSSWDGDARAEGRGSKLDITIAEKKASEDDFPVAVWTGDAVIYDKGTATILVNDRWDGNAQVSYAERVSSDWSDPPITTMLIADQSGTESTGGEEETASQTQPKSGVEDGVKSFTATVNGIWAGELTAEGLSDSSVTVNEGGVWRYGSTGGRVAAASVSLMSVPSASDGFTTVTLDDLSLSDSDASLTSLTMLYPQRNAPVTAYLADGSHADVTVDGAWYGSAVLSESSAMEVTIGKTGTWTYLAPSSTDKNYRDDDSGNVNVNSLLEASLPVSVGPIYFNPYSNEGGMVTADVEDGSQMQVKVDGTWTGSAMALYWDTSSLIPTPLPSNSYILASAVSDPGESDAEETEITRPNTGLEDKVLSFKADVNNAWVGTLYAGAGANTEVNVGENGVWRYDPDAMLNSGSLIPTPISTNVLASAAVSGPVIPSSGPILIGYSPAFPTARLTDYSHLKAQVDGKLYGGVTASNYSSFEITIGETGEWVNRYPGDPVVEETAASASSSPFPFSVRQRSTKSGPVSATLAMGSEGTVNVHGVWTGDAQVQAESSLTVNIGKTGAWQLSPDNEPMPINPIPVSEEVSALSDEGTEAETETLPDPMLAFVAIGSSLTFKNEGTMIGSIEAAGNPVPLFTDPDESGDSGEILTSLMASGGEPASDGSDSESDSESETEIPKTRVDGTVSGHWTGALYASYGTEAKVTVESGGVWDNSFKASNDTVNAYKKGQATVIDYGTLRGTVSVMDSGSLLDITVGEGGLWEVGNDLLTDKPGVAFAADEATLNITVKPGGTFKGDVLTQNAAPSTVKNDGTWVGNAEADGSVLKIQNSGNWTGNVWAKNGGTADLTITGTWTGMVKDPELETPKAYLEKKAAEEAIKKLRESRGSSAVMLMAVATGTNDAAAAEEPAAEEPAAQTLTPVNLQGSGAVWNVTESGSVGSVNLDSGTINFPVPASADTFKGTTLTVNGDFTGNGGTIVMNTALESDDSETDLLKITGSATGKAYVRVNNVGGKGRTTSDGIKVIDIAEESSAVFETAGTVRGGAYVYDLGEGTDGNWYLSSLYSPAPEPEPEPAPEPDIRKHKVRPEAAAYATNLYAANTLFSMRMSDRMGESTYTEALKDTSKNAHGVWIRTEGGHTRHEMTDTQTTTRGDWGLVQVGGDVASWPAAGAHRYHVGLMAGYAHETSKTGSSAVDYTAKGKVNGYSVGLYGTWMNSDPTGTGPYVDTWLMYQRFKNTVESSDMEVEESYHTKGFTASLEAGYTFGLKDWKGSNGFDNAARLRLEGQVIRMGVRGGDHLESTGTLVQGTGAGNVRTRVGVTAYHLMANSAKGTAVKPYVSLNWYHDTKSFGSVMDGVKDKITGSRNFGEVKLGVEGKVTKNVNLWGAAGYQMGSHGLRNVEALIGAKILF